ncbi:hypothetical protein RhiirC2_805439 [Rhizophagus irregularis]|uniref:Uncharacterized protein n=1 Tax=Rhizophagus irregularis TaxID=588596 RepID=A0A2N1KU84_9GLOM|nr:hypothetical protein RhiirC2_805439 [Rhizophagus irregularis]
MHSGASAFKIIQTSKGKRKLVGYFENWKTTLKALDSPPVSLPLGKELKWCQHSIPNLKKARKPKTKKTQTRRHLVKQVKFWSVISLRRRIKYHPRPQIRRMKTS